MPQSSIEFMRPSPLDRIVNRVFGFLVKIGFGLAHNFLLEVQGRKSGRIYATPVNVLTHENKRYLVAPRGDTQWVRNVVVSQKGDFSEGSQERKRSHACDRGRRQAGNLKSLRRSVQTHGSTIFSHSRGITLKRLRAFGLALSCL